MPQRREKTDKSNPQDAFLGLLTLLESPEPETVDSVKNMIYENLNNSKDSRLLNNIVDFYVATHSKSSFEILLHLRDPHDKHLFEKINEMMKDENTRYNALQLLGHIVYKQPTWLYKIATQRLMHTLLNLLKNDFNCPNLLSGLFILICLIPTIPHQFGNLLSDAFDIFSRLAAWNVKKPNSFSDILNLHLQTGIYSLFHRLYGMFPCNFLAYLRSFYGGRDSSGDNARVFSSVIKPMLERVRLHPLLITASKETELNVNRWKRMAYHDIIVECSSISLDTIEGTFENFKRMDSSASDKVSSYESASSANFHCNSSTTMDLGSAVNDISLSNQEHIWTPAQACTAAVPTCSSTVASPTTTKGEWDFKTVMNSSTEEGVPLDFAIEAKPELLKSEIPETIAFKESLKLRHNTGQDLVPLNVLKKDLSNEKEDDTDKEVSELTSAELEQSLTLDDIRHDTPFCSTTQNLTAEPANIVHPDRSENEPKNDEEDEVYNSMQEADLLPYVTNFTRYRYFSQCGNPPDMKSTTKTAKSIRSSSCPPIMCSESDSVTLKNCDKTVKQSDLLNCSNIMDTSTSAFLSLNQEKPATSRYNYPVYKFLMPSIVNSLHNTEHPIAVGLSNEQKQIHKSLSPPELLDNFIQQSSSAYLANLPLTSKRDTDWTHFGGKPPSDEIDVLRNQILLLHNMLLFERHRKDIHSERNRSILGRAKQHKMNEECINSLKTDISILINENSSLHSELSNRYRQYLKLQEQKRHMKEEFDSKIFKSCQENHQLLFSNKQMQTLLVGQKEENDEIRELYKTAQCEVAATKCKLKNAKQELEQCQRFRKEVIFLSKQLIMLQELNTHYKNKIEQMKKPKSDIEAKYLNDSLLVEVTNLKQKLETETTFLDSSKEKIIQLENLISDMKLKQKEASSTSEKVRHFYESEIKAQEDRLKDLEKVSTEKNFQILSLHAELNKISLEYESLQKKSKELRQTTNNGLQPLDLAGCDKNSSDEKTEKSLS